MKFKALMTVKAIVCLGFAPVLLFFPAWIIGLLGAAYGSGTALTAREYGATLVGNLLLTWLARGVEKGVARTAIVWDLFIYDAIALIATLILLFKKELNPLAWGVVAIYLFFTIGFGSFALRKEKAA